MYMAVSSHLRAYANAQDSDLPLFPLFVQTLSLHFPLSFLSLSPFSPFSDPNLENHEKLTILHSPSSLSSLYFLTPRHRLRRFTAISTFFSFTITLTVTFRFSFSFSFSGFISDRSAGEPGSTFIAAGAISAESFSISISR
ncbi:hypothetical protein RIF29_27673 [Crotalaria pallida]|uniref:Uncharacterized protein n=1 Tax=Crotalaria pallida TaxID=3830 RepID=A0AAN9EQG5_CROPI